MKPTNVSSRNIIVAFGRQSSVRLSLVAVLLAGLCFMATSAAAGSMERTWKEGLTDQALAMQRWFSHITWMQGHDAPRWDLWHDDGAQLGVTAFRYQFAFSGYGCAALAAQTPAYHALVGRQLRDLCERMIDLRTWSWVTRYWDYGEGPPDPCQYENVMYTGHLTQLMCLYELFSGDTRYSEQGWDFVWEDGRAVHYTLDKAVRGLYEQSKAAASGGICCEPGLIFAACNAHSAASFMLHDMLHGTNYSKANDRWYPWMREHFRNRIPFTREFLYVVYQEPMQYFIPVGDVGNDCWVLGWSYPWMPDNSFLREGWNHIVNRIGWIEVDDTQCYAQNNQTIGCCGGGSLGIANAFIPLTGFQAEGRDSQKARQVLNWLETRFGRAIDTTGNGHNDSYIIETCPAHYISATGLVAAALVTDGDSMRNLYRTPRNDIRAAPTLAHVDYPNVYVRAAEYQHPVLRFVVLKGNPDFTGDTEIICTQIYDDARVYRNGKPWNTCEQEGATLRITTDLDQEQTFEVRIGQRF